MLLPLGVGAWLAYRSPRFAGGWAYAAAVVAAAAVPVTGGDASPLLPYLLAPGLALGLTRGPRELLAALGASAGALSLGTLLPQARSSGLVLAGAQWLLLSLALGLVATWARRLAVPSVERDDYLAVRDLLEQLRSLTRHLPGGLDAPSAAEGLLDRCARLISNTRSAVLVQPPGGAFVPLAVRGTRRVPWRDPLEHAGPLRTAWETARPVVDQRKPDKAGRRRGNTLVALPLLSSGRTFGLVVLESQDLDGFTASVVDDLTRLVKGAAVQLETAMLFEEVRLQASTEERDRLAREMHDGIAQELAFVGYRLDELRGRAAAVDPELADAVGTLRTDLTSLISDIRLSITDLKTTVRSDRGLGAALSAYLHAVCSGKKVVLNLSLQETAFRLPGDQEVAIFKAAQAFAQEVRRSPDVRTLTVSLLVDPPSARLRMASDGPATEINLGEADVLLARVGAEVRTSAGKDGGPNLDIELKGGTDDHQRPAGRRSRPDPAGLEAGLRAD